MRALLLTAVLLLAAGLAGGQTVYRCTAPDGRVSLQQAPCDTHKGVKGQAMAVPQANVAESNAGEVRSMEARLAIARGQIVNGMTEAEVVRALGQPTVVNTDQVEGRTSRQLVYRYADGSTRYVYTRDGLTYATQDRPGSGHLRQAPRRECFTAEQIQGADANAGSLLHSGAERERRRAEVERMKLNRC